MPGAHEPTGCSAENIHPRPQKTNMRRRFIALMATIAVLLCVLQEASATAQFSRQYDTPCNTCHTAFPKLNDVGMAFKDAGFQFSDEDVSFIAIPRTLTKPAVVSHSTRLAAKILQRAHRCRCPDK